MLPRYEEGQVVRVRRLFVNRHYGEQGLVIRAKLNQHGERVLDKYIIQFSNDEREEFWGIQLEIEQCG